MKYRFPPLKKHNILESIMTDTPKSWFKNNKKKFKCYSKNYMIIIEAPVSRRTISFKFNSCLKSQLRRWENRLKKETNQKEIPFSIMMKRRSASIILEKWTKCKFVIQKINGIIFLAWVGCWLAFLTHFWKKAEPFGGP